MDNIILKQILAKNILRYMSIQNMDRQKMAKRMNVKYSTFCDWVQPNHPSYPKIDKIQAIADILNVKTRNLIEENSDESMDFVIDKILEFNYFVPVFNNIPADIPFENLKEIPPLTFDLISKNITKKNEEYFALNIIDDSMEPNYKKNNVVTFLKTNTCNSGDDCCIRIKGNDSIFTRITFIDDGIMISPLNLNNSNNILPKIYQKNEIEILGIAIGNKIYK